MTIMLNNKPQEIADHLSLAKALHTLEIHSLNGVAVAVNNTVIPKKEWDTHQLQPNDILVLIRASQGG